MVHKGRGARGKGKRGKRRVRIGRKLIQKWLSGGITGWKNG
jgi:hypothetical protein